MAGTEDKPKLTFDLYDFDSDERWKDYSMNLTIPPEKDIFLVLKRYKQKFFKRYVDPDFEVEPLPQPQPQPQSAPPPPRAEPPRSYDRNAPPPRQQSRQPSNDFDSKIFYFQCAVILASVLGVIPILPAWISDRAYRVAVLSNLFCSGVFILFNYGGIPALNLASLKQKLTLSMQGPEVFALFYSFIFLSVPKPISMALVPIAVLTVTPVAKHLSQKFSAHFLYRRFLQTPVAWVLSHRNEIMSLSAVTEIVLGFTLIGYLLTPQRSIFTVFGYWQFLKLKFHAPLFTWYHKQVWSEIGNNVEPLINRFVPMLSTPLGFVKGWFSRVG